MDLLLYCSMVVNGASFLRHTTTKGTKSKAILELCILVRVFQTIKKKDNSKLVTTIKTIGISLP